MLFVVKIEGLYFTVQQTIQMSALNDFLKLKHSVMSLYTGSMNLTYYNLLSCIFSGVRWSERPIRTNQKDVWYSNTRTFDIYRTKHAYCIH